jgi:predicted Zn finger-like uncharacterized protein
MSLITRCPSCATMFKVVPDQLRISDGWVRCGHCGEVFDAADHLQDESQPAVAAFVSGGQQPVSPPTPPLFNPPSPPPSQSATPMNTSSGVAPSVAAWDTQMPSTAPAQWSEPAGVEPPLPVPDAAAAEQPVRWTDGPAAMVPVHADAASASSTWNNAPLPEFAASRAVVGAPAAAATDPDATAWQPLSQSPEFCPVPEPMPWEESPDPAVEHDDILGIPLPVVPPRSGDEAESTHPLPLTPATPNQPDPSVDPVDEFMQEAIAGLPSSGLEPLSVDSLQPSPPSIEQELAAWTADRRPSVDEFASAPAPLHTRPQDLEFVREAQRKAFWRRPLVRGGLWLAGLLLVSALAAQWAVHDRDRIAAFEPRARPALEWLCSFSGCKIAAFKQIESISIDSSSFSKTRDNLYMLNVVIKNSARIELAMPSLELTLTDSQDQPLLRRVLTPAELGAPPLLAASGDWSAALPVSVAVNGIASRVAGYRVLAFYP